MSGTVLGNGGDGIEGKVTNPTVSVTEGEINNKSGSDETKPAYSYDGMIGENGFLREDWRNSLPEGIRNEHCLDSIGNFSTLVQNYVHAQRSIGARRVAVPGENASEDDWSHFYNSIGRPESADGYKTEGVELPEGLAIDDDVLKEFRTFAHKNGFTQKTFEAALQFDLQRAQAAAAAKEAAEEQEYNATMDQLHADYGVRADGVIRQCEKAMDTFGLRDVLTEHGLLNNYQVVKALAAIGERISESRLRDGNIPASSQDPAAKLNEIMGNPDDPYFRKDHPGHDARVQEVQRLLFAKKRAKE